MKKKPIGIIFLISFNQLASLAKLPLNLNLEIKLNHTKSEFRLKVNIFWYNWLMWYFLFGISDVYTI